MVVSIDLRLHHWLFVAPLRATSTDYFTFVVAVHCLLLNRLNCVQFIFPQFLIIHSLSVSVYIVNSILVHSLYLSQFAGPHNVPFTVYSLLDLSLHHHSQFVCPFRLQFFGPKFKLFLLVSVKYYNHFTCSLVFYTNVSRILSTLFLSYHLWFASWYLFLFFNPDLQNTGSQRTIFTTTPRKVCYPYYRSNDHGTTPHTVSYAQFISLKSRSYTLNAGARTFIG